MNFKMIVVVLGIAVVPVCVQAQAPNPPKASRESCESCAGGASDHSGGRCQNDQRRHG